MRCTDDDACVKSEVPCYESDPGRRDNSGGFAFSYFVPNTGVESSFDRFARLARVAPGYKTGRPAQLFSVLSRQRAANKSDRFLIKRKFSGGPANPIRSEQLFHKQIEREFTFIR